MSSSQWDFALRLEHVSARNAKRIRHLFQEVEMMDPAAEIESAVGDRLERLRTKWKGYQGVRLIIPLRDISVIRELITLLSENTEVSERDLIISFKAYSDSEFFEIPVHIVQVIREIRCGVIVNYTSYI